MGRKKKSSLSLTVEGQQHHRRGTRKHPPHLGMMMMSGSTDDSGHSAPVLPDQSAGSSVSSRFQDEYEELLKYAVVVPNYDPKTLSKTLVDTKKSFPPHAVIQHTGTSDDGAHEDDCSHEDDEETLHDTMTDKTDMESVTTHSTESVHDPSTRKDFHQSTPMERSPESGRARPSAFSPLRYSPSLTKKFYGANEAHQRELPLDDGDNTSEMSTTIDKDMGRMEGLLEQWNFELKRNVLAEFGQLKIRLLEQTRQSLKNEEDKHKAKYGALQNEIENFKELLHTYEQSIERKDQVIDNLTKGMQAQKEKQDLLKSFCEWKARHNDAKREAFAYNLAKKHHQRILQQRAWSAWHSVIVDKWRQRVEKACQAKAQEVCMQLTDDYEAKLASLDEALKAARDEVNKLHTERDRYEEMMKKAFMRGVCALNMEAMTMFNETDKDHKEREGDQNQERQDMEGRGMQEPDIDSIARSRGISIPAGFGTHPGAMYTSAAGGPVPSGYSVSYAQEPVFSSDPPGAPSKTMSSTSGLASVPGSVRVVGSIGGSSARSHSIPGVLNSRERGKSAPKRTVKTKITARPDGGRVSSVGMSSGLGTASGQTMNAIIVERHNDKLPLAFKKPVVEVPVSPRSSVICSRRLAGQVGEVPMVAPNIQTVKVVD